MRFSAEEPSSAHIDCDALTAGSSRASGRFQKASTKPSVQSAGVWICSTRTAPEHLGDGLDRRKARSFEVECFSQVLLQPQRVSVQIEREHHDPVLATLRSSLRPASGGSQ